MNPVYSYSRDMAISQEAAFFRRIYTWMTIGLALTGAAAWVTSTSPTLLGLIFGTPLIYALIIGELVLVWVLSARVNTMKASSATTMFIIYSALNGVTLAAIFIAYTRATIATAFFVTAGTFAAMSAYGYLTRRSLQSWGSFLFMGLLGIIIASLVNLFVGNRMLDWIISYAGVLIFVGLTAYDTQRLRVIFAAGFADGEEETKSAVMGALALYLDFINLFLMLLRIFGRRD